MDLSTYLKNIVKVKLYQELSWLLSAFTIAQTKNKDKKLVPYELVCSENGIFYYDPNLDTLVKLANTNKEPLFTFKDKIIVDESWLPNITGTIRTTIGNLLTNAILLTDNFGSTIPYMTGRINIQTIEDNIAKLLVTDKTKVKPGKPYITVEQYKKFVDSATYLKNVSGFTVISATPKNIQPAPGIEKYKAELIKKYKDRLTDPIVVAKIEKALQAYDDDYLKDDPSFGIFMSGKKVHDMSRKKLFLMVGLNSGFGTNENQKPVISSLHEGWPKDPEELTAIFNEGRSGSYNKGAETQNGGLVAKIILRALGNIRILKNDCKTKVGKTEHVLEHNYATLVNRYYIVNGKPKLIENIDQAKKLIGKTIQLRSPLYCKSKGERRCNVCVGESLAEHEFGVPLAMTEMSAIILTSNLKAIHGKVLSTTKYDINGAFK